MKKYITASAEDKFWDLYNTSMEIGDKLEDIITDMGLEDEIFTENGEPTASEEDYEGILREYEYNNGAVVSVDEILKTVTDHFPEAKGVKRAWFEDEINAIRFTTNDGNTYQLVLQNLKGI